MNRTGTAVPSNSGSSAATTAIATLASTTPGAYNIVIVSANTSGATSPDPAQTLADGTGRAWTTIATSWKTGSPSHRLTAFGKFYVTGDPAPTVTIAANGNIENAAIAYSGVDTATPVPSGEAQAQAQSSSSTAFATPSITTAAARWLISAAGDRTAGTTWTGTDSLLLTGAAANAANLIVQDSNGTLAAGTYSRTLTASAATSVGNALIFALNPASAGTAAAGEVDLALTAAGAGQAPAAGAVTLNLTVAGAATTPAAGGVSMALSATAGPPAGAGNVSLNLTAASTGPSAAAAGTVGLTMTAAATTRAPAAGSVGLNLTAAGATQTRLAAWLSKLPLYVAHRGGDNDWVEMTRDAYTHAIANGATAINIDGVRCASGEFVGSHDLTTGRVFGTNYTIGSTPWSTLSSLTTSSGGFPIEKVSDLLAAFPNVVVFADNKGNASDDGAFLDMLDAAGGPARLVVKAYYTASQVATDAHARGYTTWGYYYAADLPNLAATQSRWDLLGLDYTDTSSSDWTSIKSWGKPVLGHVIPSAAGAAQAFSEGADGIMTGKVLGVIPNSTAAGTIALNLTVGGAARAPDGGSVAIDLTAGSAAGGAASGAVNLAVTAAGSIAASPAGIVLVDLTAGSAAAAGGAGGVQFELASSAASASPAAGSVVMNLASSGAGSTSAGGGVSITFTAEAMTGGSTAAAGMVGMVLTSSDGGSAAAAGGSVLVFTATSTTTAAAGGTVHLALTAAAGAAGPAGGRDVVFSATLAPQTHRLTAVLGPQSHRFTATLGGQP